MLTMEEELIKLRSFKIENEAQIAYQEERIKSLTAEIDQKTKAFQEVEINLIRAQEIIEEKNLLNKDAEQKISQMRLIAESEKALIAGLQGEKKHLEMNLKENMALKEQFKSKCDQVQEMYESLFKEAQVFKR